MTTREKPMAELDVYERVQRLADYLDDLIRYFDKGTAPSDEWLTALEAEIAEVRK